MGHCEVFKDRNFEDGFAVEAWKGVFRTSRA
jgi:hypothetical protein